MTTNLNRFQMNMIAGNSTSYEMVVSGVMKKQRTIERANYIWTDVMGKKPIDNGSIKLTRGEK